MLSVLTVPVYLIVPTIVYGSQPRYDVEVISLAFVADICLLLLLIANAGPYLPYSKNLALAAKLPLISVYGLEAFGFNILPI